MPNAKTAVAGPVDVAGGTSIFEMALKAQREGILRPQEPPETVPEEVVPPEAVEAEDSGETDDSPEPTPAEIAALSYPRGTQLFTHTFPSTGVTVALPMVFELPGMVWRWELWDKPAYIHTWAWLKQANVPKGVQHQIVSHWEKSQAEYLDLFNKWFDVMGGGTAGE